MKAIETQTVYTEVFITPCPSGFGEYQCGELSISPECSYACLQDLEYAGDLTPIDDALADPEFQAAGIQDIRGRIHNQPGRIYAKLEQDAFGVRVAYCGVEESEVPLDFYEEHPAEPQASLTITYSATDDWGADGAWWEGDVDLDAEAKACGFDSTPAVEIVQLSDIAQLDDDEFCRIATAWGLARRNNWTSADVDRLFVAEINRRGIGTDNRIGYAACSAARLPDLPHLSCPVGNQWSKFEWSKSSADAESCQCGGCGTWQSAEEAWKQYENQNQEAK